jgi:hypothetical protein
VSAFISLLFVVKAYRLLFCLQEVFIPCVIHILLYFTLLYLTGRVAWKMFKEVHWIELHKWLVSVSKINKFLFLAHSDKVHDCFVGYQSDYLLQSKCVYCHMYIFNCENFSIVVWYVVDCGRYLLFCYPQYLRYFVFCKIIFHILYVVNNAASIFWREVCFQLDTVCLYLQKIQTVFTFIQMIQNINQMLINRLKSPVAALYKINIIILDDLVSSSTAQIFKSFS